MHKFFPLLLLCLVSACTPATPLPTLTLPAATQTLTAAPTELPSATPFPTQTSTSTSVPTATITPTPVYTTLRARVTIDQAVCHYGPGKPYLYKYGVYKDSNLEVISRDPFGVYLEVQAIGGNNPCWVRAEYMLLKGDLNSLKPVQPEDVVLPKSPYYGPPGGVSASRKGDQVTVTWQPLVLRAGDDSEQTPYILEAWVCQDGSLVFTPLGTFQTTLTIKDESGCAALSRARLLAAEKHGYTRPVVIDWP